MNYVQIMGGLGNQLFQYVFSKYIEHLTGKPSALHTGFFGVDLKGTVITPRAYSLDFFNTDYICINENIECERVIANESDLFDANTDNTFFSGYWQDKRFYYEIRDLVDKELQLKPEFISREMSDIAKEMSTVDSVSLHVRRTDYLNQQNKDIFLEPGVKYYHDAVSTLIQKLGHKPVLYIFSDDHDYISSNMNNFCGCETHIMKPRKDYEDIYLMSQAKHHIIANSTFSWWGAVLGRYPDGITIAPMEWYKDGHMPDLYPDSWICIPQSVTRPKISIIIPAYNVESYIDACLTSIEKQTYGINNLEIILVNDASTDNTLKHLKAFEAKYPNEVILVNLDTNSGQGAARNAGLDYASGEYVTFIDSDDLIDKTMLRKMMLAMDEYDCELVECGHSIFSDVKDIHMKKDSGSSFCLKPVKGEMNRFAAINSAKTAVWARLYKRKFLSDNSLYFIEGTPYEDIQFSGISMFLLSSYYRIGETLYYYRCNREGTVFSEYNKSRVHREAEVVLYYLEELQKRNMLEGLLTTNRIALVSYCMNKAFIDPLTLLLQSSLSFSEIYPEIEYFKDHLLELFPDAPSLYFLSDEFGISDLSLYLLTHDHYMAESYEKERSSLNVFLISDFFDKDYVVMLLKDRIRDASDRTLIDISPSHYMAEHLLIKHIIRDDDIVMAVISKYNSVKEQVTSSKMIRSIVSEYPSSQIFLVLKDLYYDESDESMYDLSLNVQQLSAHQNLTILLQDEETYTLCKTLMPDINCSLCPDHHLP